ncbi:unnamed protein product [Prorocentrum cordatum]|uniref:Uncharacterized protein n=1 Tax=Prorocentrum cordatum TaxID=2364126 RepID=A0ABN9SMB5_9DINO|nr:unnamed protein product [Polarella glacialis]
MTCYTARRPMSFAAAGGRHWEIERGERESAARSEELRASLRAAWLVGRVMETRRRGAAGGWRLASVVLEGASRASHCLWTGAASTGNDSQGRPLGHERAQQLNARNTRRRRKDEEEEGAG